MNKRNFLALFLIFFIFLICLNSVSAQDVLADGGSRLSNNQSGSLIAEGYNGDENHELLGVESSSDYELLGGDSSSDYELLGVESSNENILTNGEFISNFTALNKSIYECDGVIELNSNITRLSAELNNTSIIIDKNITINGNGYTIDCGGQALFKISSNASLVLNNLTMVNAAAFYSIRHYFVYSDANNNTFLFGPGSPDTPYSRFEITSTVEDSVISNDGVLVLNNCRMENSFSSNIDHDGYDYSVNFLNITPISREKFNNYIIYNTGKLIINSSVFNNCSATANSVYYANNPNKTTNSAYVIFNNGSIDINSSSFNSLKNFLMNMGIINVNSTSFNSSSNFTYNYGVLNLENVNLSYFSKFLNYNSICLNHSEISQFSGSIENYGNLIIDSSDFSQGNPIINNDICNITNTKFHDYRIASYVYFESYGSILINNGNANILNSEFKNCTLGLSQFGTGSGLLNSGNLSVISSVFENVFNDVYIVYPGGSEFSTYLGNVIYNEGNLVANYNVFVNNTKLYHTGKTVNDRYDIYNSGGRILSCDFNWWGSNNPAFENLTNFDVGNWVVMDLDSEYSSIGLDERISINVCLNRLNDGSEIPDLEKLPVRKVIFDCIIQTLDENLSDNNYLSSTGGNLTGGAFTTEFLGNDVISGFVVYVNIDNFILESVIDVGKYNASLSFDYENITYFDDFTFSLNLSTLGDCDYNLSGKFNLILNGTVYEGVLNSDCTGSLLIEKLSAGNYDMKIVYMGNEYYARAFGYANLTVERYSPMISAIAEDIVVGQKVIVNVTSNIDSIEGFCKLTINNRNYSMYIHKGTASLKISNLQVGDYVVTVFYQGSENFMPANATIHFSVYRNITEKIATTTSIFVNDVMVGENATISVIVGPEDVYGYGVLTINDVAMDIYIFNGSYNLNLTDLAVGSYDVDVRYNGSYYFINSSNSTSFEVKGKEIVLDVDVQILTYEMATVNVKVSPDNISGTFIVGVNDYYYYLPFENGSSSFSMPLRDGENNLVVYCPSVDDYAFAFYNETFELKRPNATVIHYSDMVTYAIVNSGIRDGEYFKLNLTDSYGHPLVKKTVLIGFNGKVYSRTTNASGGIRLQINLASPGTYTFAICFLGDDVYAGCFAVSKITVVRSNVNIIAPSVSFKKSETKKIVSVTLRTPQGKLLKNRLVTLYVNGKSYSARTDSKGLAKISVSLSSVGIYTYTVSFSGDTQCYKATKTGKITIK